MAVSTLSAQSFEFASVKRYAAHSDWEVASAPEVIDLYRPMAMTKVEFIHASLKSVLMAGYGVGKDQITGPPWLSTEHYDIVAGLPDGILSDQIPVMLQKLLTERFRMTVHRETAPRKGFVLLADKSGPELAAAHADSKPNLEWGKGYLRFNDFSVTEFARLLSVFMGRPVHDRTEIQGNYDITLKVYGADLKMGGSIGDRSLKYVTDALRDLGLKLESGTVPATNIVVDKADRIPAND